MNYYHEIPCKCNFTHEKNPEEFELFPMKMGTVMGVELPPRPTLRCKTCKTVSLVKREGQIPDDGLDNLDGLRQIVNADPYHKIKKHNEKK